MNSQGVISAFASDINLSTVLRNGQSFRWKITQCGSETASSSHAAGYVGVHAHRVWLLKQADKNHNETFIDWRVLARFPQASDEGLDEKLLKSYLRLSDTNLSELYDTWSVRDAHFRELISESSLLRGIPILAQSPLECLLAFICSSNNNIKRISGMVESLCELWGDRLTLPTGETFYDFPSLAQLTADEDSSMAAKLRARSFGYRAGYIAKAVHQISEFGGEQWLESLRALPYDEAKMQLLRLAGVGPKVADCVLLMGLGHAGAIPVDTHVLQVTVKRYPKAIGNKAAKQASLTKSLYDDIGTFYRSLFGSHAGWAQSVLFTSNLAALSQIQQNGIQRDPAQEADVEKLTVEQKLSLTSEKTVIGVKATEKQSVKKAGKRAVTAASTGVRKSERCAKRPK